MIAPIRSQNRKMMLSRLEYGHCGARAEVNWTRLLALSREIKRYLSRTLVSYTEEALNMINHISYTIDRARNRFSESHFEEEVARWLAVYVRDLMNSQIRLLLHFI
jgi:hypothetical protein